MNEEQLFEAIERLRAIKVQSAIQPWTLQTFTNRNKPPAWIRVNQQGYVVFVEIVFKFFSSESHARWTLDYIFKPEEEAVITIHPPPAELLKIDLSVARDLRTWGKTVYDNGSSVNSTWAEAYRDILLRLYRFTRLSRKQGAIIEQKIAEARRVLETPAEASA